MKVDRNSKLEQVELSLRTQRALESLDLVTVGDLEKVRDVDLLKLRNFGRVSLREVKNLLEDAGLSFRDISKEARDIEEAADKINRSLRTFDNAIAGHERLLANLREQREVVKRRLTLPEEHWGRIVHAAFRVGFPRAKRWEELPRKVRRACISAAIRVLREAAPRNAWGASKP